MFKRSATSLATAVDQKYPHKVIYELLTLLKQKPPAELQQASVAEMLNWGIEHWNPMLLENCQTITRPSNY